MPSCFRLSDALSGVSVCRCHGPSQDEFEWYVEIHCKLEAMLGLLHRANLGDRSITCSAGAVSAKPA
jgi:hypothetical protein